MSFYDQFFQTLKQYYPRTSRAHDIRGLLSENLISPHQIELPVTIRDEAQKIVDAFFALRNSKAYQDHIRSWEPEVTSFNPGNYSALMSFDFHLTEENKLKLIEINTNASMGLVTQVLYNATGTPNTYNQSFNDEIIKTFQEEFQLSQNSRKLESVAIVDENPEEQRLYVEFLLYKELFESHGWRCHIVDPSRLSTDPKTAVLQLQNERIDLVYNRDTDFYLQTERTQALRRAYLAGTVCLTPNPHEYHLLADKQRLEEISTLADLGVSTEEELIIRNSVPKTVSVGEVNDKAELWDNRKKLFFKPKRSFGGKATYRGASVSRVVFERIVAEDYIAQEFVPAPTIEIKNAAGQPLSFKYDLRFFVYKQTIQIAAARLYHGQMTNFQSPEGGMAVLRFK